MMYKHNQQNNSISRCASKAEALQSGGKLDQRCFTSQQPQKDPNAISFSQRFYSNLLHFYNSISAYVVMLCILAESIYVHLLSGKTKRLVKNKVTKIVVCIISTGCSELSLVELELS